MEPGEHENIRVMTQKCQVDWATILLGTRAAALQRYLQAPVDGFEPAATRDVGRVRSYHNRFEAICDLYDLAGWRPECRDAARAAARRFFDLPEEVTVRVKDVPTPDDVMAPLMPFLDNESDGAGDPRDVALWCRADRARAG